MTNQFGGADFLTDLVVAAYYLLRKCTIVTINISFECARNKQQHGTKITCTEVRKKLL